MKLLKLAIILAAIWLGYKVLGAVVDSALGATTDHGTTIARAL